MAFSYDKLWKLLIDKKMTKENFRVIIKASPTTIAAMGKGEGISPKVLDRICTAFDCQPGDIMEHIPSQENSQEQEGTLCQHYKTCCKEQIPTNKKYSLPDHWQRKTSYFRKI